MCFQHFAAADILQNSLREAMDLQIFAVNIQICHKDIYEG